MKQTIENDCEDQGCSKLSDGCYNWKCLQYIDYKLVRPQLIQVYINNTWWWICPKCQGSYGKII